MKIVFMGSPDYAVKILDKLYKNNIKIEAVFTQPDKPVGRKKVLTPTKVKEYAIENGLPVFTPSTLKNYEFDFNIDFVVVAAYGLILPKNIVNNYKCINLHASLLPKYRGASPIQSAILNGDKYTGVTAMLMDEGLDTGDMLSFQYTKVGNKNSIELFDELANLASEETLFVLNNFNKIKPLTQIEALATYSPKIKKSDGYVDFSSALEIDRKYRAFIVWPGIFYDKFKINKVKIVDTDSINKRGEILEIKKESVIVGCSKGKVELIEIQIPSKKPISASAYVNGRRLKVKDLIL